MPVLVEEEHLADGVRDLQARLAPIPERLTTAITLSPDLDHLLTSNRSWPTAACHWSQKPTDRIVAADNALVRVVRRRHPDDVGREVLEHVGTIAAFHAS